MAAEAAHDQRAHALAVSKHEKRADPRPHRIAHHIGALDLQVVEQIARIIGHDRRVVILGVVQLFAASMAAIVERDDTAAVACKRAHPEGKQPVHRMRRSKPVNQQNGFTAVVLRSLVNVSNAYAVRGKLFHGSRLLPARNIAGKTRRASRPTDACEILPLVGPRAPAYGPPATKGRMTSERWPTTSFRISIISRACRRSASACRNSCASA